MDKVGDIVTVYIANELSDTRYTRTHAQDIAQHTCRHVRLSVSLVHGAVKAALFFSRLRDWFTSLLYFTQGAKMGRRKQSRTCDSQQKLKIENLSAVDGHGHRCDTEIFQMSEYNII